MPRQDDSNNGTIRDYKFYVGNGSDCNNIEWVEVASSAFDDSLSKEEKRVCFAVATGRFVKLEAISEVNGGPWTSAAKLNVLCEPVIGELPDGVIDLPEEGPDPVMITAGDSVEFAGTGYGDTALTYLWNFGDPAIPVSGQQNPGLVQFNTPGTHTVTFTVCNSNGCDPVSASDTRTIIVECHDPILQDNLSVCAFCSEETAYYYNLSAENAIDGDPNTFWHTEWINTPDSTFSHWIEMDMGALYDVSGFTYLPRQDSSNNGTILGYKFYVGNGSDCDNVEWVEVASGTFDDSLSKEEKRVCFTVTTGRFVRLEAISEVNGGPWTSAAELNVLGEPGIMPPG